LVEFKLTAHRYRAVIDVLVVIGVTEVALRNRVSRQRAHAAAPSLEVKFHPNPTRRRWLAARTLPDLSHDGAHHLLDSTK
jgi:hypothetical protein